MSEPMLFPNEKPFNFWNIDEDDETNFKAGIPEFFYIPLEETSIASVGYWDGEELIWLAEYYHASGNELVFYGLAENSSMDELTSETWMAFVAEKTPQCLPWILFRLKELNLA